MRLRPLFPFLAIAILSAACTDRRTIRLDAEPGGGGADGSGADGGFLRRDGSTGLCGEGCGPEELCGSDGHGTGIDEDCDYNVDETCRCTPGETRPCYAGPASERDVGVCAEGLEYCSEFETWGTCSSVRPSAEVCNGADDDCNSATDDGLAGCTSAVACPANEVVPPLATHTLRGDRVYSGAARSWSWTISCPMEVPVALCPTLSSATAEDPTVYFAASGAYRVTAEVVTADGSTASCAWIVYVRGGGLRVEVNWDTMLDSAGGTDVDLHLHRWTSNTAETDWYTGDDCFFGNCQPDSMGPMINWVGHPDSELSICQDAPHGGGAAWRARGGCRNPRLDVDTNGTDGPCDDAVTDPNSNAYCAPENINVDSPIIGAPYRIMVNYYSDSGTRADTNPTVNIYCAGALRGSFGRDPVVTLRNGREINGALNDNWMVADVVFYQAECGLDCQIYPVGGVVQGVPGGLLGLEASVPFDPPWSCTYDPASSTCNRR